MWWLHVYADDVSTSQSMIDAIHLFNITLSNSNCSNTFHALLSLVSVIRCLTRLYYYIRLILLLRISRLQHILIHLWCVSLTGCIMVVRFIRFSNNAISHFVSLHVYDGLFINLCHVQWKCLPEYIFYRSECSFWCIPNKMFYLFIIVFLNNLALYYDSLHISYYNIDYMYLNLISLLSSNRKHKYLVIF